MVPESFNQRSFKERCGLNDGTYALVRSQIEVRREACHMRTENSETKRKVTY
jgi:hypothetical protein